MVTPAVVMLIEDNEDHAELAMKTLDNQKFVSEVLWFANGESALDYLQEHRSADSSYPDLILLDIKLPGKSGFDVLEAIKSNAKTKRLPVIMLTTSALDEEVTKGYELGANSYIVKPINFEQFQAKLMDLKRYWVSTSELPRQRKMAHKRKGNIKSKGRLRK